MDRCVPFLHVTGVLIIHDRKSSPGLLQAPVAALIGQNSMEFCQGNLICCDIRVTRGTEGLVMRGESRMALSWQRENLLDYSLPPVQELENYALDCPFILMKFACKR